MCDMARRFWPSGIHIPITICIGVEVVVRIVRAVIREWDLWCLPAIQSNTKQLRARGVLDICAK